jgi:hypothetical protein
MAGPSLFSTVLPPKMMKFGMVLASVRGLAEVSNVDQAC